MTLQAKLREAEAAHDAAKAELRRREEADRATAAQLSEADRQQQELKRKADDDHANAARETAKRRRIEDDAKVLDASPQQPCHAMSRAACRPGLHFRCDSREICMLPIHQGE